ncbi:MAG: isochorismatase family protein [Nakamurella sp.]
MLLIDLMRAYFTPSSPLDLGSDAAVEASGALLASARKHHLPVVHTVVHYRAGAVDAGLFAKKVSALLLLADDQPGGLRELMPQVAPLPAEPVIIKQYASAFFGTSLSSTLSALGVDTVVIAGVSTSGCIRASATDAMQHGFRPMVVGDACADRTDELHRSNLRDLNAKYADVLDSAEVLARFAAFGSG